jgi:hypothetical protein
MSFASDEEFLGAVALHAPSGMLAPLVAHLLGCNPGGEVSIVEVPFDDWSRIPEEDRGRVLTKAEVEAWD